MKNFDDIPLLDKEDEEYLEELHTRFRVNQLSRVKKLNSKKLKNLKTRLTKKGRNTRETNEVYWLNKNELEEARKEAGFSPIKIETKTCLKCFESFESEGKHNRKCDKCRREDGYDR